MKLSYAIPVCNEHIELERLLSFLRSHIDGEDEIVVQCDKGNTTLEVLKVVDKYADRVKVIEFPLNGHFSNFKNNLKENCTGDWIFQIDADEIPHEGLIANLKVILKANPTLEMLLVPRVNTVEGLTKVHEVLEGYLSFTTLPEQEVYSLYHPKTINRQEKQNNFYETI